VGKGRRTRWVSATSNPFGVDFVADKASEMWRDLQASTGTLIPNNFQTADFNEFFDFAPLWFGTRGSEVQILSPRLLIVNDIQATKSLYVSAL
jgi:hypothetical protein